MTGGTVVVLGKAGRNFAAGMSGGVAYVLDTSGDFKLRCNRAMVELEPVAEESAQPGAIRHLGLADEAILRGLIERHLFYTGSTLARSILDRFAEYRAKFVKVMPHEYRRALGEIEAAARVAAARSAKEATTEAASVATAEVVLNG